ncbi:ABC transporter permease [Paenibacillus sp. NRS-1760]|uniref:ABC transporter permease n=1 Tax=Paenibacillus sp. NRS-1760 TaxID=3233902 RepID=UPI003D2DA39F
MLHLIKLEMKKGRMSSYVWGALIAFAVIAGFSTLFYFVERIESISEVNVSEVGSVFESYANMFFMNDTLVRATFIIYASVLLAKLVISEYQNKTMSLLFTYPVSRKKLIFAKLIMVAVWAFTCIIIANALLTGYILLLNSIFGYIDEAITIQLLGSQALNVVIQAIGAAGMSLLPLVFGLWRKSVPATVVSSILVVSIVCSNTQGFTLSSIVAIPLVLAAVGVLLAYLSFRNVDLVDVE